MAVASASSSAVLNLFANMSFTGKTLSVATGPQYIAFDSNHYFVLVTTSQIELFY